MSQNKNELIKGSSRMKKISQLDLFGMSKESLIKKIQTMVHQLKVFYKMIEQQPQRLEYKTYAEKQVIINSLTQNQVKLKSQISKLEKNLSNLKLQAIQKDEELEKYKKQNQLFKKRVAALERNKLKAQEQLHKQFKHEKTQLQAQNCKLKKQLKSLNSKIRILEELNRQTELKVAEKILQNKTNQQAFFRDSQKQNCLQSINVQNQRKTKVQMMALKQQAKQLRERLRVSQQERQIIKSRIQQREVFYSKMISNKH